MNAIQVMNGRGIDQFWPKCEPHKGIRAIMDIYWRVVYLHHGSQIYPMTYRLFPWSIFWKIQFRVFGSLTRCKPNMDQEQLPCTTMQLPLALNWKRRIKSAFLYHSPLTFAAREPLLPLTTKLVGKMTLDNVGLKKRPFGELEFHGHSCFFFLM